MDVPALMESGKVYALKIDVWSISYAHASGIDFESRSHRAASTVTIEISTPANPSAWALYP